MATKERPSGIPSRNPGKVDAQKMVEIVADAQRSAGVTPNLKTISSIFCLFTDPVKTVAYRQQMLKLRELYKGLAQDEELQKKFRQAVELSAPQLRTVRTAVKLGVSKIVLPAGRMGRKREQF